MAKKYHPDTNKDDPQAKEKFAQLAEAYEVRFSPGVYTLPVLLDGEKCIQWHLLMLLRYCAL